MNSCDCFIGDIVRPKGFILTDFYILGLSSSSSLLLVLMDVGQDQVVTLRHELGLG